MNMQNLAFLQKLLSFLTIFSFSIIAMENDPEALPIVLNTYRRPILRRAATKDYPLPEPPSLTTPRPERTALHSSKSAMATQPPPAIRQKKLILDQLKEEILQLRTQLAEAQKKTSSLWMPRIETLRTTLQTQNRKLADEQEENDKLRKQLADAKKGTQVKPHDTTGLSPLAEEKIKNIYQVQIKDKQEKNAQQAIRIEELENLALRQRNNIKTLKRDFDDVSHLVQTLIETLKNNNIYTLPEDPQSDESSPRLNKIKQEIEDIYEKIASVILKAYEQIATIR